MIATLIFLAICGCVACYNWGASNAEKVAAKDFEEGKRIGREESTNAAFERGLHQFNEQHQIALAKAYDRGKADGIATPRAGPSLPPVKLTVTDKPKHKRKGHRK